jgi:transcription-repair coupling factor (superfamily II helicase)
MRRSFKEEIQQQEDYVKDCVIDTDLEILIPDAYVESITERLSLYTRLDNCENEEELTAFHTELQDRFGPIPPQVEDLFTTVRCRRLGVELGFEKMTLKDKTLRCYFINNPDSPYFESNIFQGIMQFVQTGLNKARLKQTGKLFLLIVEDVSSMEHLLRLLTRMHQSIMSSATA